MITFIWYKCSSFSSLAHNQKGNWPQKKSQRKLTIKIRKLDEEIVKLDRRKKMSRESPLHLRRKTQGEVHFRCHQHHLWSTKTTPAQATLVLSFCCWRRGTISLSGKPLVLCKWPWLCLFTKVKQIMILITILTPSNFSIEIVKTVTSVSGHLASSAAPGENYVWRGEHIVSQTSNTKKIMRWTLCKCLKG